MKPNDTKRNTHVVDHKRHGGDINTTCQDVGGDKNLGITAAESINDGITLSALDTTSEGRDGVTLGDHAFFDFHGGSASLVQVSSHQAAPRLRDSP